VSGCTWGLVPRCTRSHPLNLNIYTTRQHHTTHRKETKGMVLLMISSSLDS
jgi:hypothetical protein